MEAAGISELTAFAAGLRKDWAAVQAGLTLPWSSGSVEGHVNRIKMLKRQVYGRTNVDLLRRRVLLAGLTAVIAPGSFECVPEPDPAVP